MRPVILIADADPAVRAVARRYLEADGYEIVDVPDGDAALAFLDSPTSIAVLVADLTMPGVEDEEMARRARLKHPDLRILYVSGVIERRFDGRPLLWQHEAFLEKPFTADGLREAVAWLLFGTMKRPT